MPVKDEGSRAIAEERYQMILDLLRQWRLVKTGDLAEQCLNDFAIPLMLKHTVVAIHGTQRVEGITIAEVDESMKPIPGTERHIDCDTLLLSVGFIPENELSRRAGLKLDPRTGGPVAAR